MRQQMREWKRDVPKIISRSQSKGHVTFPTIVVMDSNLKAG